MFPIINPCQKNSAYHISAFKILLSIKRLHNKYDKETWSNDIHQIIDGLFYLTNDFPYQIEGNVEWILKALCNIKDIWPLIKTNWCMQGREIVRWEFQYMK